jgi:hypothetical protein
MLGLMYFYHVEGGGRLVLVPDGTNPGVGVVSHYARFFIEKADLQFDDWWPAHKSTQMCTLEDDDGHTQDFPIVEFRIPERARVVFDADAGPLEAQSVEALLPKLRGNDPRLIIDPDRADTIAQIPIRSGTLTTFKFADSAAVQWSVEHEGPIVITATLSDTGEALQIVLNPSNRRFGTEIVFTNSYDLLAGDARDHNGQHGQERATAGVRDRVLATVPGRPAAAAAGASSANAANIGLEHVPAAGGPEHGGGGGGAASGAAGGAAGAAGHRSHFQLYSKLDVKRRAGTLDDPTLPALDSLPFEHKYLRCVLDGTEELPGPGCSPTCC